MKKQSLFVLFLLAACSDSSSVSNSNWGLCGAQDGSNTYRSRVNNKNIDGQPVQLTGIVFSVDVDFDGAPIIVVHENESKVRTSAFVHLKEDMYKFAQVLNRGDVITVIGAIDGSCEYSSFGGSYVVVMAERVK